MRILHTLLKSFFFTIECNYSQYGFRPSDYEPYNDDDLSNPLNEGVNGEWIEGLFHKNDGYLSPAVLTPFRENGLIDYIQEDRLANLRLITLTILYYTQNKQFIPGYTPSYLTYTFDKDYANNLQSSLAKCTNVFNAVQIGLLMSHFEAAWEKLLYNDINGEGQDDERSALLYLGYKSLKICLKYKKYQRHFALKTFSRLLNKGGDAFDGFIHQNQFAKRINSIVKALYKDKTYIALKIHQCITFLRDGHYAHEKRRVYVDDFLKGIKRYTYDSVYMLLPPPYFKTDLAMTFGTDPNVKIEKTKGVIINNSGTALRTSDLFRFSQMSSGERQLMNSMSYILYHIKNIQSIVPNSNSVPYHHINLIFDEAELYFHPEYQRLLLCRIIEMLHWSHIDRRRIRSINIILATHSPYVLSDVFTEKSLYLKSGERVIVTEQSFGANYYNMLHDSFFFNESPMGRIATQRIQEWIETKDFHKVLFVGDPIIRNYLQKQERDV